MEAAKHDKLARLGSSIWMYNLHTEEWREYGIAELARDFAAWVMEWERDCRADLMRADEELKAAAKEWDAARTTRNSKALRTYLGNAIAKQEAERDIENFAPLVTDLQAGRVDFSNDITFEYWTRFLVATGRWEDWEVTGLKYSDLATARFESGQ